ncbi:MAG: TIGR02300 family protein [Candidatus Paracaedibacter sp.]
MTNLEWGTKRACQSCTARFYDMRRSPIICPKCGETFEIQTPGRRSRSRSAIVDDAIAKPLEDDLLIEDLDLPGDLDADLVEEDDDTLIEDTSDLGEDLDDMADVIDTVDDGEEQ